MTLHLTALTPTISFVLSVRKNLLFSQTYLALIVSKSRGSWQPVFMRVKSSNCKPEVVHDSQWYKLLSYVHPAFKSAQLNVVWGNFNLLPFIISIASQNKSEASPITFWIETKSNVCLLEIQEDQGRGILKGTNVRENLFMVAWYVAEIAIYLSISTATVK